jgi:hypothetical protein
MMYNVWVATREIQTVLPYLEVVLATLQMEEAKRRFGSRMPSHSGSSAAKGCCKGQGRQKNRDRRFRKLPRQKAPCGGGNRASEEKRKGEGSSGRRKARVPQHCRSQKGGGGRRACEPSHLQSLQLEKSRPRTGATNASKKRRRNAEIQASRSPIRLHRKEADSGVPPAVAGPSGEWRRPQMYESPILDLTPQGKAAPARRQSRRASRLRLAGFK